VLRDGDDFRYAIPRGSLPGKIQVEFVLQNPLREVPHTEQRILHGFAEKTPTQEVVIQPEGDPRSAQAEERLASGGVLSVQVLNEFVSFARKKILMSCSDAREALDAFRILCPLPVPIAVETHDAAVRIAATHGHNIYDALIIAAALEAGCVTLYSQDLHDGQTIDGQLTIRNPFAKSSG
jgi:predicted nucleic acid-binding protein